MNNQDFAIKAWMNLGLSRKQAEKKHKEAIEEERRVYQKSSKEYRKRG